MKPTRHVASSFLLLWMVWSGGRTLLRGLETGETWRAAFAATGMLIFLGLLVAQAVRRRGPKRRRGAPSQIDSSTSPGATPVHSLGSNVS